MITNKYINIFIVCILALGVVFTGILVFIPGITGVEVSTPQPDYASEVFNKSKITSIDIKVDEKDWQDMLNTAKEEYITCDVTINGTTIKSVGIRPKGNSSLQTVAKSDSDRFSFKFEFDQYIQGQTYLGLDKMVINNVQSDASYMKDYLSYDLMTFIGVKTPLFAYTNVTVNGKTWGFYIAVEALEESFAQRNFGTDYGMLYKPESMEMGANGGGQNFQNNRNFNTQQKGAAKNGNANGNTQMDSPENGGKGMRNGFGAGGPGGSSGGGTDLIYTDDRVSSYSNIFDNEVFEGTEDDYNKVIRSLKNLNSGTELEKYIDVDATLRYFAASTVLVNMDSYFSNMKHNYYLYEEDGKLSMLPWDYNLAFGGFQSGSASATINFPIDTPVSGVSMSERPMLSKLLEVDEYRNKYHQYLQQIVDEYFNSGKYEKTINDVNNLIAEYVKNDASAFYTYDKYTAAVSMMKEFGKLRAQSIDGQLKGSIPSTTDGQSKASGKLIDASSINLATLGSQGFGAGGGWGGNRQSRNTDNSADNNTQQDVQQNPPQQNNQAAQDNQQADGQQNGMVQPPDGFQPSDGNQMPDGGQPPDGMQQERNRLEGNNQGMPNAGQGGFGIGAPGGSQQTSSGSLPVSNNNLLVLGGILILLMAGLVFVIRFKRNKYV